MNLSMEELSRKIMEALRSGDWAIGETFSLQLNQLDFEKFLVYNFKSISSASYLDLLMLGTKRYWESFDLSDWQRLMTSLQDHVLALHYCLTFVYKYLKVDSIHVLKNLNEIDGRNKTACLQYVERSLGAFAVVDRIHLSQLNKFKLSPADFEVITERLLGQGARKAKVIPPVFLDNF